MEFVPTRGNHRAAGADRAQRKLSDPACLKKLYVGYAAMQVGDIITTTTALNATILTIEKLRERHPVAASY